MDGYVKKGCLEVSELLYEFINQEVLPESGVDQETFWKGFGSIAEELCPLNEKLLAVRDRMQKQINGFHLENGGKAPAEEYQIFLEKIGYLEKEPADFSITTGNVDEEVSRQAGPQLVVPINNARYAINAVNARWGSLYDALYGSDIISDDAGTEKTKGYNPERGSRVIDFGRRFLDESVPLAMGSHANVTSYYIKGDRLYASLNNGEETGLARPELLRGWNGPAENPSAVLLKHNGLHIEIQMDPSHPIGSTDSAGIKDIFLEAAVTVIMDCEDSVAAVDAEDKVWVYRNWLGLMRGDLKADFEKNGKAYTRRMNPDRRYTAPGGGTLTLSGRSLMFIRNVGHLMTSEAVLVNGNEIYEGILDGVITSLIARHAMAGNGIYQNSKEGSVYIVKPKMHGPAETAFANELFNRIENLLGLERYTIKIGVMDEERRTTLNLKSCIKQVKDRIVFINTGFLDRTGDEIHTSMEAGPMIRKNAMKSSKWLQAYEKANVMTGLKAGFRGTAQIGKGMWAMPDLMKQMLEQKIGHLKAGAATAWVPSPTAAVIHAIHYHQCDVSKVQKEIEARPAEDLRTALLEIPAAQKPITPEEIQEELENNAQGILGYVVRWVEQGIGCSKVPDYHNIGLMEDRATLRISSQHMANWLHHGICTKEQIIETMQKMARVVDQQNAGDPAYRNMADNFDESIAFQAACELVFEGTSQPNGYTEPILHRRRKEAKAKYGVTI